MAAKAFEAFWNETGWNIKYRCMAEVSWDAALESVKALKPSHNSAMDAIALCKDLGAVPAEFLSNHDFISSFVKRAQCIAQQYQ
jgi:hypothetical protein